MANKTENSISPEPPLKHPLEHRWTLWFYENDKRKDWLDNLHDVYTFETVEDFWWYICKFTLFKNKILF